MTDTLHAPAIDRHARAEAAWQDHRTDRDATRPSQAAAAFLSRTRPRGLPVEHPPRGASRVLSVRARSFAGGAR